MQTQKAGLEVSQLRSDVRNLLTDDASPHRSTLLLILSVCYLLPACVCCRRDICLVSLNSSDVTSSPADRSWYLLADDVRAARTGGDKLSCLRRSERRLIIY